MPADHICDAAPAVEPAMQHPKLRLRRRHEREADGGGEETSAGVGHDSWFRRLYFAFGPRGVDVAL